MHSELKPSYIAELEATGRAEGAGDFQTAFTHLERAHILKTLPFFNSTKLSFRTWDLKRRSVANFYSITQILSLLHACRSGFITSWKSAWVAWQR
ncbi:hypothetical protein CFH90_18305 (plasmid) [Acinetobacter johnsonii]|uniref:Uncharacterized protein n=1 Tax=Acinetobacter johnsonii TaxID=40214 RepID=A0A3Q8XGJ1_ACIJO|nr:DUF3703 domain-containing protein [Acinetobacter johnsonii]AZN65863.1 hypothetical protein CFH90_18305 [Acinetobacter johnsonii]